MSTNPTGPKLSSAPLHPFQPKPIDRGMPPAPLAPEPAQLQDPAATNMAPPIVAPHNAGGSIGSNPAGSMAQSTGPAGTQMVPYGPAHGSAGTQMVPYGPAHGSAGPLSTKGGWIHPNKMISPILPMQGRNDMAMYFSSDDRVLSKHVEDTHVPDDSRIDEVRPLFYHVQELFAQTAQAVRENVPGTLDRDSFVHGRMLESRIGIPNLPLITERISFELASRRWGGTGGDAHETTMAVLKLLSHYTWEAKSVLTLAAFSMGYGEFWLLAQIFTSNQIARSMAVIKQVPLVMENPGAYKGIFEAIDELIQAMLKVTDCIIQFRELPPVYVPDDDPAVKAARTQVPIAVYWTIRSAVTAATQITALTNVSFEYITTVTDVYELQNRTHKLMTIYQHFMMILNKMKEHIDKKREDEAYEMLVTVIYSMIHVDNMPVLSRIVIQEDTPALYDGASHGRVHLDVLRRKNVLLLISDLNISPDELSILEQIYNDSKIHAYEILWLPIIDPNVQWTDEMQVQFERLRGTMPWYAVHHPSNITKAFIKFARNHWNFRSKPVLVVLDPRGKVLSPNAMHMMWIWGSSAFPFTTEREEMLWREEMWRLELLVDGIDQTVLDWIREKKYIFIYGGDDLELIRRFTKEARTVAQTSGIKLEMMYVGKGNKKDLVRRICSAIVADNMSNCWQDPPMVWFFWKRIESMLFSKIELKKADDHSDVIIQEIKKLLSYDKIPGGWALFSSGSEIIFHGQLSAVVTALARYERETPFWKNQIPPKTFAEAFREETTSIHVMDLPCCKFEFPVIADPVGLLCPECHRSMERHSTFICCHEGGIEPPATTAAVVEKMNM